MKLLFSILLALSSPSQLFAVVIQSKSEARDELRTKFFIDYEDKNEFKKALNEQNKQVIGLFIAAHEGFPFNFEGLSSNDEQLKLIIKANELDLIDLLLKYEGKNKALVKSGINNIIYDRFSSSQNPLINESKKELFCSEDILEKFIANSQDIDPNQFEILRVPMECYRVHAAFAKVFPEHTIYIYSFIVDYWFKAIAEKSNGVEAIFALKALSGILQKNLDGAGDLGMLLSQADDGLKIIYRYGQQSWKFTNQEKILKINGVDVKTYSNLDEVKKALKLKPNETVKLTFENKQHQIKEEEITANSAELKDYRDLVQEIGNIDEAWFNKKSQEQINTTLSAYLVGFELKCSSEKDDLKILKQCSDTRKTKATIDALLKGYYEATADYGRLVKSLEEKANKRPMDQKIFEEICSLNREIYKAKATNYLFQNMTPTTVGNYGTKRALASQTKTSVLLMEKSLKEKNDKYKSITKKNPDIKKCPKVEDEEDSQE